MPVRELKAAGAAQAGSRPTDHGPTPPPQYHVASFVTSLLGSQLVQRGREGIRGKGEVK